MRKNRSTRLANRVGSVEKLFMLLAPLVDAARNAEGRDKLPTRRKVETHHQAIAILEAREKAAGPIHPNCRCTVDETPAPVPAKKSKKVKP